MPQGFQRQAVPRLLMRKASLGLVALLLLAGCSDGGKDPVDDADFSDLDLQASQTTGVIRGVVVDGAIRPVADAAVSGRGPDGKTAEATTNAEGLFGLEVAPGTWFLSVTKAGYGTSQVSTEVVAGVAEPAVTKVLLNIDPSKVPYVETYVFDGYLECGVTTPPVGVALCFAASEVTNDNTQVTYPYSGNVTWAQTEMVWESTQQLGNELALMYSYSAGCGLFCDHEVDGPSPLLLQANETVMQAVQEGSDGGLYIRVFNSDLDETDAGLDDVCTPIPDPVLGNTWCLANGVGATIEQRFSHYTHVFYGYAPDPSWRFTSGEPVPQPPTP